MKKRLIIVSIILLTLTTLLFYPYKLIEPYRDIDDIRVNDNRLGDDEVIEVVNVLSKYRVRVKWTFDTGYSWDDQVYRIGLYEDGRLPIFLVLGEKNIVTKYNPRMNYKVINQEELIEELNSILK